MVGVGFGGWDDVFEKKGKMNNQCSFQTILLSVLTGEANGGVLGLTPESSFGWGGIGTDFGGHDVLKRKRKTIK